MTVSLILIFTVSSEASIVTISLSRTGPIVIGANGNPVSEGLLLMGTLSAIPESDSAEDIAAVFEEFRSGATSTEGLLGRTFENSSATSFDNRQIYIWAFDSPAASTATSHSLLTVSDPNQPIIGNAWVFPTHLGACTEERMVLAAALLDGGGDLTVLRAPVYDSTGSGRILLTIPEPSTTLLGGLAAGLLIARRGRPAGLLATEDCSAKRERS